MIDGASRIIDFMCLGQHIENRRCRMLKKSAQALDRRFLLLIVIKCIASWGNTVSYKNISYRCFESV